MFSEIARIVRVAGIVILGLGIFISAFRWVAVRATGIPVKIERSLPEQFIVFMDPFHNKSQTARENLNELLSKKIKCFADDVIPSLWLHAGTASGRQAASASAEVITKNPNYLSEDEFATDFKDKILKSGLPIVIEVHQSLEQHILAQSKKLLEIFPKAVFYNHFHKINDKIVRLNPQLKFASHQAGLIKNQLYLQLNVVDPSLTRFEFFLIDKRNLDLLSHQMLEKIKSLNVRLVLNEPNISMDELVELKAKGSISGYVTGAPSQSHSSPCQYE